MVRLLTGRGALDMIERFSHPAHLVQSRVCRYISCIVAGAHIFVFPLRAKPDITIVDPQEVADFFGTRNVKVVFTDDQRLYYVDFAETGPASHQFVNVTQQKVAAPVISPDGQWIAYSSGTGIDANSPSPSTAWIIPFHAQAEPVMISEEGSGYVPRFMPLNKETSSVIYATCGTKIDGKDYSWDGCGQMMIRDIVDGIPGTGRTVYGGGSFFGGISADSRYLCSGENRRGAFMLDLDNQNQGVQVIHWFAVTHATTGNDTDITLQTCNPSISQSARYPGVMMFLDFGFPGAFEYPDIESWGFHQILFITSIDNEIMRYFRAPRDLIIPGYDTGAVSNVSWIHSEWSNHPYYAVAAERATRLWPSPDLPVMAPQDRNEHITAINLKDSSYLRMISATDTTEGASVYQLSFMHLWVEIPDGFEEDDGWLEGISDVKKTRGFHANTAVPFSSRGRGHAYSLYTIDGRKISSSMHKALKSALGGRVYFAEIISDNNTNARFYKRIVVK
ncbi:MAG: hypothetical protein GF350_17140 [Chitinivibrionales bacterium]|nr:hypothetical protein [Chitinivibrionales bacterium]